MNWRVSCLANINRKELRGVVRNGRLLSQMEVGQGSYSSKEWIVSGKVTCLREGRHGFILQITLLVLTR